MCNATFTFYVHLHANHWTDYTVNIGLGRLRILELGVGPAGGRRDQNLAGMLLVVWGLTALWDSISVYIGPSRREGERDREMIDESKNVQTNPIRIYCKRSKPLLYYNQNL